jgi:hypothetical protein
LRRPILAGLTVGSVLGGLFGLAVVSFADCSGPDCTYQRVVGVVAHAAGAGVAGGAAGLLVHAVVRLLRRRGGNETRQPRNSRDSM